MKCFHCHQHGNFTTNYPQKKKNKNAAGATVGEALALQFELDFSLIACLVSSTMGSVWYLDSGASFHMTGDKELFSDMEEKDSKCIERWETMVDIVRLVSGPLPLRGSYFNLFS